MPHAAPIRPMIVSDGRRVREVADRRVEEARQRRGEAGQEVGDRLLRGRVLDEDPDHAAREDRKRDDREQRVERDAGREQPAAGDVEPVQHQPSADHAPIPEQGLHHRQQPLHPGRRPAGAGRCVRQRWSSSNRPGWRSSARTRRGPATSALTSPRRTNRRPPSLMLWSLPARAQPRSSRAGTGCSPPRGSRRPRRGVIQSAAGRRHQSLVDPAGAEPLPDRAAAPTTPLLDDAAPRVAPLGRPSESLELDPLSPLDPLLALSSFFDDDDDAARAAARARRSFFAQPVPLKWIVGAREGLRIVPSAPHTGQNVRAGGR